MESAQPAPAVAEAGQRPQGSGRRPRPRRLHARASSHERRPHRRGDRRAQDRAARCRDFGGRCRRRARAVPPDPRRRRAARAAGKPGHGRLRRGCRVRHHRALGQEFPQAHPPAAGTAPRIRDVRRRALRRHAHHRRRLRARLRPHRAVRRRRPPDHRADEERACRRRAPGLRLPDGAAAHRRRQDRQPRQSAGAAAGGGHRRRAHRHRHRNRGARLLSAAGGEVPAPLRDAARGARRSRHPRRLDHAGSRDRVRVSRARARHPRRARAGRARGPQAAVRGPPSPMGRRHHRLPAAHDRFPELHAQPRRGGEGAGGGDRFLRTADAGRGPARSLRLRAGAAALLAGRGREQSRRGAARSGAAGAHDPGGGRHPAQYGAWARGAAAREHRRQVLPGLRRERPEGQRPSASPSRRPRMC